MISCTHGALSSTSKRRISGRGSSIMSSWRRCCTFAYFVTCVERSTNMATLRSCDWPPRLQATLAAGPLRYLWTNDKLSLRLLQAWRRTEFQCSNSTAHLRKLSHWHGRYDFPFYAYKTSKVPIFHRFLSRLTSSLTQATLPWFTLIVGFPHRPVSQTAQTHDNYLGKIYDTPICILQPYR
jgi:hypothetical protein